MAKIYISNYDFADELAKYAVDRVENLIDDTLMMQIASMFERYCEPYVPYLHGPLSQTTRVTPEYVEYEMPYAHYQYTGQWFDHTLIYHPLATAYWDQAMLTDKGEEFLEQVRLLIINRARQLYG